MGARGRGERELFRTAARDVIALTQAQRARRTKVRKEARDERFRARRLRETAGLSREVLLASRWNVWTTGVLAAPPETFPASWADERDAEALVREAVRQCSQFAAQAGERAPVVRALCEVSQDRLVRQDERADLALSLTVRMLDLTDSDLEGDDAETVLFACACRRCAAACRRALLVLYSGD